MGLHQTKNLLYFKGNNQQSKKANCQKGKDIWSNKELISKICKTKYQKEANNPIKNYLMSWIHIFSPKKTHKGPSFIWKIHITNYQGNVIQNFTPVRKANIKIKKNP